MARKEIKLRPSLSWAEIASIITSLELDIASRVQAGNYSPQTLALAQVKNYLDTFKPVELLNVATLAKYQSMPAHSASTAPVEFSNHDVESGAIDLTLTVKVAEYNSPLDNPDLSDEQKLEAIKLKPESKWTEDEKIFVLNVGTLIMMRKLRGTAVNEGDL